MADLHIGGWRDEKLSALSIEGLKEAVSAALLKGVDFVIIAGDLYNTALPGIDYIKQSVEQLKRLNDAQIPCYIIAGSHDYSPSGKTMLEVLEQAGLVINVVKAKELSTGKLQLLFTTDSKTGAKLTGMLGKKNMLERSYYEAIDQKTLEHEEGFKIFVFHTALDELKPKELEKMDSNPLSLLPKNFDYYAGGHVHIVAHKSLPGYKNVIYPGPIFPNSFSELQKLHHGGYYLYDEGTITHELLKLKPVQDVSIDCDGKSPEDINAELKRISLTADNAIVLLSFSGKLGIGKSTDLLLKETMQRLYDEGAYVVLKNTSGLHTHDFEEIKKSIAPEHVEDDVITEHLGQTKVQGMTIEDEKTLIGNLLQTLSSEKGEGETNTTYEKRILDDTSFL